MEDASGNVLDVKMPGSRDTIFPWLEVVTNAQTRFLPMTREVRFLPVIRRVLVGEGEFVRIGERILELEDNEYYTSSVGHLCSPATGVIRKWHIREDRWDSRGRWEKGSYIGDRQYTPNYGQTLVTIELAQPTNLVDEKEIGRRLVSELIGKGRKARVLNMAGDLFSALLSIFVIFVSLWVILSVALAPSSASAGFFLLVVPLILIVVCLSALAMRALARKVQRNWRFVPSSAFGVGPR